MVDVAHLELTLTYSAVYTKFGTSTVQGSSVDYVDAGSNQTNPYSFKLSTAGYTVQHLYISKNGVYSGCYFLVTYTVASDLQSVSGLSVLFVDEIGAAYVTASANYTATDSEQGIEESEYDISLTILNPNSGICSV